MSFAVDALGSSSSSISSCARLRRSRRGFSLADLLVGVAIIGVLASLAAQGMRRYMGAARSAEALHMLTGMANGVTSAYEQQRPEANSTSTADFVTGSGNGATVIHRSGVPYLCGSADPVPASLNSVKGKKYTPNSKSGFDYETGDSIGGWACLMFTNSQPQSYQLEYTSKAGASVQVQLPKGGSPPGLSKKMDTWSAIARGDTDGDGIQSTFVLAGAVVNGTILRATAVQVTDQYE
jgi:type IV pilus assembly protein PilA